ncbi:MAG: hypothetical protein JWN78_1690 [Bacteroidota bacterium]|nr:hypothetical protein [Bacteroidota bacterium]
MKRLIIITCAGIITMGGTSSCSKQRTCSCVDTTKTIIMFSDKKSAQKKKCDDWAAANQTSCTIK